MGDDQSDELMFEKLKSLYEPKSSPIPPHMDSTMGATQVSISLLSWAGPRPHPPSPTASSGSSVERPHRTLGLNSGSIHRDLNQLGTGLRRYWYGLG